MWSPSGGVGGCEHDATNAALTIALVSVDGIVRRARGIVRRDRASVEVVRRHGARVDAVGLLADRHPRVAAAEAEAIIGHRGGAEEGLLPVGPGAHGVDLGLAPLAYVFKKRPPFLVLDGMISCELS